MDGHLRAPRKDFYRCVSTADDNLPVMVHFSYKEITPQLRDDGITGNRAAKLY